jgi:hypothetical protein
LKVTLPLGNSTLTAPAQVFDLIHDGALSESFIRQRLYLTDQVKAEVFASPCH